jgi:uncharacterized ferritin-like protein (DUF455 family)
MHAGVLMSTVEAWAKEFVLSTDLGIKLAPPPVPKTWDEAPQSCRLFRPGRPPELGTTARAPKSPGEGALRAPQRRAELVHTFLHHELQAAELMAWALLAFPETPRAFRGGLLGVLADEVRHMGLYRDYLVSLGFTYGSFPVRDWFWERVPSCPTAAHFTALMGMGFEGGNLDHTQRFAKRLRAAGDARGAELEEQIGEEEIPHVRFALAWFQKWTQDDSFGGWTRYLVPPLTPSVMRGQPINRESRLRSGMSHRFIDDLAAWSG